MADNDIPQEVKDKFSEVFGSGAETEENTDSGEEYGSGLRQEYDRQAEEALVEEGLVDPTTPDGEPVEAEEDDQEDVVAEEGQEAQESPQEAGVTIDPNLRMVAEQAGWTEERLNRLYKADPELAEETLNSLAETYTNLSRQFLNQGGSTVAPSTPQVQQQPAQPESPVSKLDQIYADIAAFAENNGEELAEFIQALKAEVIDPVRSIIAQNQVREQELIKTEALSVMDSLSSKFGDFYGVKDKELTVSQREHRAALGRLADQIRAGARLQGVELSVKDALNRAHLVLTADMREQAVRKEIKEQVQTRRRQFTARPTNRSRRLETGGKSRKAAEEAYASLAAEYGFDVESEY